MDGTAVSALGAPAVVSCSIWPARRRYGPSGRHFTHEGEADTLHYEAMRRPNRALEVEGTVYRIVEATLHELMIPPVELDLLETRSG